MKKKISSKFQANFYTLDQIQIQQLKLKRADPNRKPELLPGTHLVV
jgi:hypothetical protein